MNKELLKDMDLWAEIIRKSLEVMFYGFYFMLGVMIILGVPIAAGVITYKAIKGEL